MRIGFSGNLLDERVIRAGFIGCGSHSFRNVYPTFQFAPVALQAVCDLSIDKAQAFAEKFGAKHAYSDYHAMLEQEELDAVFIVVGYDKNGRPMYPQIAVDCLNAGLHVWIEKPPAASCAEVVNMREAAVRNRKNVMVGLKKMFFPANVKAKELMGRKDFGDASLVMVQYPQYLPTVEEFKKYKQGLAPTADVFPTLSFLDHLCHPVSLILYLCGMPKSFYYQRSAYGAGMVTFSYDSGVVVSLAMTQGSSLNGGMEHTMIVSNTGRHIVVDNNHKVSYHQSPPGLAYGATPSFYQGAPEQATAVWEPEFSLGNLYNKGLFLLGYYGEVAEFAASILEGREPCRATLAHAWQATHIFERFSEGPGREIELQASAPWE